MISYIYYIYISLYNIYISNSHLAQPRTHGFLKFFCAECLEQKLEKALVTRLHLALSESEAKMAEIERQIDVH